MIKRSKRAVLALIMVLIFVLIFIPGCNPSTAVEGGIDEEIATYVFDLMEKFAGYGFNKSHSAAYALVAYQTAWLKAHYPAAFMAAVLSSDMDNTDKIVVLIAECQDMKLPVCPPNINVSNYQFTVNDENQIVYGIGAIKGVGEAAIEDLIKEREANGPFEKVTKLGVHENILIGHIIRSNIHMSLVITMRKNRPFIGSFLRAKKTSEGTYEGKWSPLLQDTVKELKNFFLPFFMTSSPVHLDGEIPNQETNRLVAKVKDTVEYIKSIFF